MKKQKEIEAPAQIQLELPDYSQMYYEYMKKKDQESKPEEAVIIIDIY
jgi:hypothetical protein